MQKRSHKLLASMLLESEHGLPGQALRAGLPVRFLPAGLQSSDLFERFPPARKLRGHNFTNSRLYIESHIKLLQARTRWNIWQYYTLGKLTHYLADAFTYPHNEHYPESLIAHRQYEADLRQYLADYLENRTLRRANARQDLVDAISELHAQYMSTVTDMRRDVQFILRGYPSC